MPYSSDRGGFVCKKELGTCPKLDAVRGTLGLQEREAHKNTMSFSVQLQDCHPKARGMHNSIIFLPLKAHIIITYALILTIMGLYSFCIHLHSNLLHFSRMALYFLKQVKRLCVHLSETERDGARAPKPYHRKPVGRGSRAVGLHLSPTRCSAALSHAGQVLLQPREGCGGGNAPAGEQGLGEKVAVVFGDDPRGAEGEHSTWEYALRLYWLPKFCVQQHCEPRALKNTWVNVGKAMRLN